ncbi:MAG: ribosomal protein S18-alanine N-acetyltransferase [Halobacteria archaeon]|nr:ribosomal protein S18-alanine N-acetyltransferase [Halobacteria archaeon]
MRETENRFTREIRPAKPHDISGVLEVESECFKETNTDLLVRLCGVTDTLLVSTNLHDIEGYILVAPVSKDKARVISLGVKEDYRQQGVGRSLMREGIRLLLNRDVNKLELEVRVSNTPAKNLYKEMGFSKIRVKPNYYNDGENAYLMQKELTS